MGQATDIIEKEQAHFDACMKDPLELVEALKPYLFYRHALSKAMYDFGETANVYSKMAIADCEKDISQILGYDFRRIVEY